MKIKKRKQTQSHHQRQDEDQRRFDDSPNKILTFKQWCALNGIAARTGRRIIAGDFGPGPVVTRLSPRRIGISLANNAAWQASREQAAS